ncbi:Metallo-hydrolase/oxidoreductase [Stereum hirsutum FP-91666 SS1]|uniref:Metallo-hydrolase/oxidoreductase n=1 Tax=Stereum hirsutum (strain FP-91666) TaxID=721885 RepID=UPI0004449D79|nr:Metallo-hydrolase/oxidoreductase [Stereum hirsutum FP-91666 SS1]EIM84923.1 Metallo-hydrolase/oxidoreductase [Stereum hirsutum FP-91666 SS1]
MSATSDTTTTTITLDPSVNKAPYRDADAAGVHHHHHQHDLAKNLPEPKSLKSHPSGADTGKENASIYFVGTATTILEWAGVRIMTDPNFLHAGDHIHLGPGITGTRRTNPAVDLHDLPRIDLVLLSHYHADHFDEHVEATLRRDLPILTTPHAHKALTTKTPPFENFTAVTPLDTWYSALLNVADSSSTSSGTGKTIKVTAMPGKHVPPGPGDLIEKVNEIVKAVPPTNGWMIEFMGERAEGEGEGEGNGVGYRVYVSGDTLFVDELKDIPKRYPHVDLMLIHLGGTTIPGPSMPLLMVTMDATQGIQLVHLIQPDVTIPIHYDDYDLFLSPLEDFKKAMTNAGLDSKVVYLDRGDGYKFTVRE